jgi:hypothetical protein
LPAREVAAITDVVPDDERLPLHRPRIRPLAGPLARRQRTAPMDERFDVWLSGSPNVVARSRPWIRLPAGSCPGAGAPHRWTSVSTSRWLSECRLTSLTPSELGDAQSYPRRHPLNQCFDVPISEVCDE